MKLSATIITCYLVLSLLSGCQGPGSGVEIVIADGGQFPDELVGKWRADKNAWEFVFEPGGGISSAVIAFAMVEMTPGKVARFKTLYGGKGVFEPGLWTVSYDPESRDLSVEVVIKHFYQDLGDSALTGNMTDILAGPVSADWQRWEVDWFMSGRLVALVPDPNEFLNTKEPEFRKKLVFEKVEPEK